MQNRNEKQDKRAGFLYAATGSILGAHIWNELYYIPNKRMIEYHYNEHLVNKRYSFHQYLPKVDAAYIRIVKGLSIIPISAATLYLVGKSISFFERSKSKDELSKVDVNKTDIRFVR